MTVAPSRVGRAIVVAETLVLALACVLALGGTTARASGLAVSFDLQAMVPGETRTEARALTVPARATVTGTHLDVDETSNAGFSWSIELCDQRERCRAVDTTLVGTTLEPGAYQLQATVTAGDIPPSSRSTVSGRISLADAEAMPAGGGLPATGARGAALLLATGAGLVVIGAAVRVAAAFRRGRPRCDRQGTS